MVAVARENTAPIMGVTRATLAVYVEVDHAMRLAYRRPG